MRDLKYDILNVRISNSPQTAGRKRPAYRHGEDVHGVVSIRFDKELLKQAAEKDGQDARNVSLHSSH